MSFSSVDISVTGSRSYGTFYLADAHVVAELDAHVGEQDAREVTLSVALERTGFFDKETGKAVE